MTYLRGSYKITELKLPKLTFLTVTYTIHLKNTLSIRIILFLALLLVSGTQALLCGNI
jgi:hypothetical protein